jgi:exopolysaccharide production protein ExoQ
LAVGLGLVSIVVWIALPAVGKDPSIGDYDAMRGVFVQKNLLAECMVLAIACRAYSVIEHGRLLRALPSIGLMLLCIVLSHSASSLAIGLGVLGVAGAIGLRGRATFRLLYLWVVGSVIAVVATLLILSPGEFFGAIGRDTSMTGRTPLWGEILKIVGERPLLGHGYGGFWNVSSPDVQYLWLQFPWQPPGAHNGYLDMMVDLGIAGLSVLAYLLFTTMFRAVRAYRSGECAVASWMVLFMIICLCVNLDETTIMTAGIFPLLLPAAMIEASRWTERRESALGAAMRATRSPDLIAQRLPPARQI